MATGRMDQWMSPFSPLSKVAPPLGDQAPSRARLVYLATVLAVAGVYFAAAKLGFQLAFAAEQVTVVWPPTGIALAAVVLLGLGIWPGVFLGALLANATVDQPFRVVVAIAVGNTLEAVVGAGLLRLARFDNSLTRLRDVLALIVLAAGLSTVVSATVGVTSLCLGGVHPWQSFGLLWRLWWLGDAMGALVVAPVLLTLARERRRVGRLWEGVGLLLVVVVVNLIVFAGLLPAITVDHPLEYVVFPSVIWAGLRFGPRWTALVTFLTATIAVWSTVHQSGPFSQGPVQENLILVELFLAVVVLTALFLAATMEERRGAEAELRESEQRLTLALTAAKQTEAALKDASRSKDEFLAVLAHELRNPLAPLSNAIQLIRLAADDRTILDQARAMMERQVQQMVRLIDDLLDVSRISRDKLELRKEWVDLAGVVQSAVETTRHLLTAADHRLTVELPAEPVALEVDPLRLAQVVANLLNNAAKYTPPGGQITLTAARADNEIVIRVRDNGIGIPADKLPHVFELFMQVDRSLERSQGGLGVGLTLVKRLVEMHGGSVEARSDGAGAGSEFVVRLPAAAPRLASPAPPNGAAGPNAPVARRRILVVDDNIDAAESLAVVLRTMGHEARTAHDGPAALDAAGAFQPEVVFLDIGMPKMNGYDVAQRMRGQAWGKGAMLVALTGWGQDEDRRRSREAGFDEHLVKPVDLTRLAALLAGIRQAG